MELFIDDQRVDTDSASEVSVSLSVSVVTDPRRSRAGYTRTVRLPATSANDAIFGHAGDIHAAAHFNKTSHTGRVEHEGCVLIEGPLTLSRAERGNFYEVHIIGATREWAAMASVYHLSTLPFDWERSLTAATIADSWTDSGPVRFLPVARQSGGGNYSSGGLVPSARILSTDDYHPFLHAGTLLRAIFAAAGYTVESDFVDGEFFDKLYVSGNYPSRDVSNLKANMDFLARRSAPATCAANSLGRVYANPYRADFTVGNIVDTADPAHGPFDDVYSNNGCFQMDGDRIAFVPLSETSVGFRFHLRYTTDYRVKSRTRLTGFDEVDLGEQTTRKFALANPWPDRRESLRPARTYKLAVFDHTAGREYQLRYTQDGTAVVSATVGARFSDITFGGTSSPTAAELWMRTSSGAAWQKYTADWALYDSFVGETGTMDVEATIRTSPETITPGNPRFFHGVFFGGAETGMSITVSDQCWLQPVFYAQPTEGSTLKFGDVCAHDHSRMDFIASLRQMFNLCFHTDIRSRTVRIEPAMEFFANGHVVDWQDRLDLSRPVTVEELGGDMSRRMEWCYRGGDGAATRFDRVNGGRLGLWSIHVDSFAAADETSTWENPLFTPTLSASEMFSGAPAARLIQAGDVADDALDRTENLNFQPKVVRYDGMCALPAGQSWGWPGTGRTSYPLIAFHTPDKGTLCFEDRDGCTGLHRFWDDDAALWNDGRRVTAWLSLEAREIESLSFPTGGDVDFRSLYRLSIDGETALYRLQEVLDYTPSAPSTECVLIKMPTATRMLSPTRSYWIDTDENVHYFTAANTPLAGLVSPTDNAAGYGAPFVIEGVEVDRQTIARIVFGDDYNGVTAIPGMFLTRIYHPIEVDFRGLKGVTSIGYAMLGHNYMDKLDLSMFTNLKTVYWGFGVETYRLSELQIGSVDWSKVGGDLGGAFLYSPNTAACILRADTAELAARFKAVVPAMSKWTVVVND